MSNKTQLQTNNTKLDELTSLAATMKDKAAALPDAGGGSVEITEGELTVTEEGRVEPGTYKYILSSPDLNVSTRKIIGVTLADNVILYIAKRNSLDENFGTGYSGDSSSVYLTCFVTNLPVTEDSITLYGAVDSSKMNSIGFFAL